jgi:hypothetical protein
MRRLHIIPIVHSRHDLGTLEHQVGELKAKLSSERSVVSSRNAVEIFWTEINRGMENSGFDFPNMLIYQDGLPHTGHPDRVIEHRIVDDLAANGSPNHKLIQWMIAQGAMLVGTESTDLLLKEYDLVRRSLAEGLRDYGSESESHDVSTNVRVQRDKYIANRISETLGDGQTGVIFLGLLHRLQDFLPNDLIVEYPFGCPKASITILQ